MANRKAWTHALALAMLFPTACTLGQPTNSEILGRLTSSCVRSLAQPTDTVRITPDQRYEFIRTEVVNSLRENDTVVFISPDRNAPVEETKTGSRAVILRYHLEESSVKYSGAGKSMGRSINVATRVLLTSSFGEVLADTLCSRSYEDQISSGDVESLEDPQQEITQGNSTREGWLRRIAEPAVVVAASAVAVYLFFNVRSDKNDTP